MVAPYPKRVRTASNKSAEATSEDDTCYVCHGLYKTGLDEVTGSLLPGRDWIMCTSCGVWSHIQCLEEEEEEKRGYVCSVCHNVFC